MQFGDTELKAADDRVIEGFTSAAYDDQVAESLVEDELDRHPRVDTAEHGRERVLSLADRDPPGHAFVQPLVAVGDEAGVAGDQASQCLLTSEDWVGAGRDRSGGNRVGRRDRRSCTNRRTGGRSLRTGDQDCTTCSDNQSGAQGSAQETTATAGGAHGMLLRKGAAGANAALRR
ncbi:hypothetical protein GCM10009745_82920 [Kribbella yunnanensis]|uniref:Uncharacterized protein n=1 Tax=Kribbella yunnanensis TaxID=190194 RepID=A0ABN2JAH9_9ACTN